MFLVSGLAFVCTCLVLQELGLTLAPLLAPFRAAATVAAETHPQSCVMVASLLSGQSRPSIRGCLFLSTGTIPLPLEGTCAVGLQCVAVTVLTHVTAHALMPVG